MLVRNWMTSDVITVGENTPMMQASVIMKENKIRSLPIVNGHGKVAGILSDRDLKDASPSKATTLDVHELNYLLSTVSVKSLMTTDPVFIRPDETVEFAAILMLENTISSLPVINHMDSLIGIITQTDIFKALINIVGAYTGSIQFALSLEDRPGSIREVTDVIRSYGGRIVSILSTRETVEAGHRHVYIRTIPPPENRLGDLVKELEMRFVVLYAVRDLLEEVEGRRIRTSG
ncbi:MAG: CBS domain-containing protein [Deltaproteobacteria bacterium]|nr:CBS domain-containing protein [Deltaproteobacteria bacterium]MBW2170854.1 CBS domain-containing protein [Deltaproteobacteria bacterium]